MACDLTISIASFNTRDRLEKCLASIFLHARDIPLELIVVENGSADGSVSMVRKNFPSVRLLENKKNLGFGKAHNQAFELSKGRYFLVLNADTLLFEGTLQKMIAFMEEKKEAGAAGCRMYWDEGRTFIFPDIPVPGIRNYPLLFMDYCRRFPKHRISGKFWHRARRFWQADSPLEVEAVQGGFIFIRREAVTEAGLFDENYFLFFEEFDFYRRVRSRGWKIYYYPGADVVHFYAAAHGEVPDIIDHHRRSERYYYRKHYGPAGLFLFRVYQRVMACLLRGGKRAAEGDQALTAHDPGKEPVTWGEIHGASKFIMEISQDENFAKRVGAFVAGQAYLFPPEVIERLENRPVFWRVAPVFMDGSIGAPVKGGILSPHGGEIP